MRHELSIGLALWLTPFLTLFAGEPADRRPGTGPAVSTSASAASTADTPRNDSPRAEAARAVQEAQRSGAPLLSGVRIAVGQMHSSAVATSPSPATSQTAPVPNRSQRTAYKAILPLHLDPLFAERSQIGEHNRARGATLYEFTVRRLLELVVGDIYGWGDWEVYPQHRIQEHAGTGRFRLIQRDGAVLHAGTRADCQSALQRLLAANPKEMNDPPPRELVVLIHGMLRTGSALQNAERRFEAAGYDVINLEYACGLVDLRRAGAQLKSVLESARHASRVHFVVHSAGGLVVRAYLAQHRDERIGRMVMLGVPNQGAELARHFRNWQLFGWLFGPAGGQLASDASQLTEQFAVPDFEFGIVAGCLPRSADNPLVPGDDDGVVSVHSTQLRGAKDFCTLPCSHGALCRAPESLELCVHFLRHGTFPPVTEPSKPLSPSGNVRRPALPDFKAIQSLWPAGKAAPRKTSEPQPDGSTPRSSSSTEDVSPK